MLLTFTSAYQPATDLGYLLHKNPIGAVVRSCLWSGTRPLSRSYPGALLCYPKGPQFAPGLQKE